MPHQLVEQMSSNFFIDDAVDDPSNGRGFISVLAQVPRGARGRLKRANVSAMIHGGDDNDMRAMLAIAPFRDSAEQHPFPTLASMREIKPLWTGMLGQGHTPASTTVTSVNDPVINEEISWESVERRRTRGVAVTNKGRGRGNDLLGWTLVRWLLDDTELNMWVSVEIEWELTWLDSSKSQFAEWTIDQMEEEGQHDGI